METFLQEKPTKFSLTALASLRSNDFPVTKKTVFLNGCDILWSVGRCEGEGPKGNHCGIGKREKFPIRKSICMH
jgi:hypothetical protein